MSFYFQLFKMIKERSAGGERGVTRETMKEMRGVDGAHVHGDIDYLVAEGLISTSDGIHFNVV
jgi:hypothetical protein